jgi:hypothetical protein
VGKNLDGALLGTLHVENHLQPKPIEALRRVRVSGIAAACYRSYAVADTGEVWAAMTSLRLACLRLAMASQVGTVQCPNRLRRCSLPSHPGACGRRKRVRVGLPPRSENGCARPEPFGENSREDRAHAAARPWAARGVWAVTVTEGFDRVMRSKIEGEVSVRRLMSTYSRSQCR